MMQAGIFGLGPNSSLNQWTGRDDVSLQLVWQFDAFGIGNLARIKEQRGGQSETFVQLYKTQDKVAAEVTEAHANLQSAAARVSQADRSLRTAIIAYQRQRRGAAPYHPLWRRLGPDLSTAGSGLCTQAVETGLRRVLHHGRRLQPCRVRAVPRAGLPRQEITYLRPPGNIEPVDTARPDYLPPVGNGPPPATR